MVQLPLLGTVSASTVATPTQCRLLNGCEAVGVGARAVQSAISLYLTSNLPASQARFEALNSSIKAVEDPCCCSAVRMCVTAGAKDILRRTPGPLQHLPELHAASCWSSVQSGHHGPSHA